MPIKHKTFTSALAIRFLLMGFLCVMIHANILSTGARSSASPSSRPLSCVCNCGKCGGDFCSGWCNESACGVTGCVRCFIGCCESIPSDSNPCLVE
jgi:hypothetical protein